MAAQNVTTSTPVPATAVGEVPAALPCPFCGSADTEVDIYHEGDADHAHQLVECKHCGAQGPAAGSLAEAVASWNQRGTASAN
jgi:Lar family restriction alleviation protein